MSKLSFMDPEAGMPKPGNEFNVGDLPARVDIVTIDGLGRTKDDYVQNVVKDLFKARTFQEMVQSSNEIQNRLKNIGAFRDVEVVLDTNKSVGATRDGYEVQIKVQEYRRFVGGVNTLVGANDGSVVFGIKMPNILGRGERLNIEHSVATLLNKHSKIMFTKPWSGSWKAQAGSTLFHEILPNGPSNYTMSSTGGTTNFSFNSAKNIRHTIQWEAAWRQLSAASRATSFAVRSYSGPSFKSSLRNSVTIDNRDDQLYPSEGYIMKVQQEFAGLGGDVAFAKHDTDFQFNFPLPFDIVAQTAFRFGVFRSLDSGAPSHSIHDLYFLGGPSGPTTLRGFGMRSVGSRSENDYLGGQAYWASGIHLYGPLPFGVGNKGWGNHFRTHAFFNAGSITESAMTVEDLSETFQALRNNIRMAYGFGLVLRLGDAKVELNYCFPFRFEKGDKVVPGIQVGVGIEFL